MPSQSPPPLDAVRLRAVGGPPGEAWLRTQDARLAQEDQQGLEEASLQDRTQAAVSAGGDAAELATRHHGAGSGCYPTVAYHKLLGHKTQHNHDLLAMTASPPVTLRVCALVCDAEGRQRRPPLDGPGAQGSLPGGLQALPCGGVAALPLRGAGPEGTYAASLFKPRASAYTRTQRDACPCARDRARALPVRRGTEKMLKLRETSLPPVLSCVPP
jgi:hypothetical protein